MANVQKQFLEFNEKIKLKRYKENATLAEKRDRVLRKLKSGIEKQREAGENIPTYRTFTQGSYDIGVGIVPPDGNLDIDVGVAFDLARSEQPDPVKVKTWVLNAVDEHTKNVEMRGPCVTVFYTADDAPLYHVDLAVYADKQKNGGTLYLARGKQTSTKENRTWNPSDPEGLTALLSDRFSGEEGQQYRRVTRALKRFKDERFARDGHGAPRGIAIAVAAYRWFEPARRLVDGKVEFDDLQAIRNLVGAMVRNFSSRLVVCSPAEPFDDLCGRMTDAQMADFKSKLEVLLAKLREAADDSDPHTACKTLERQFGSDFPVPAPEETAKPQRKAITSSGNSG